MERIEPSITDLGFKDLMELEENSDLAQHLKVQGNIKMGVLRGGGLYTTIAPPLAPCSTLD